MRSLSRPRARAIALLTAALLSAALLVGGCGGTDEEAAASDPAGGIGSDPATEDPTSAPRPDEPDEPDEDRADVTIEVEIEDGNVSPAGEQVEASVGDVVVLEVDSDAAEELHVHSTPEQEFVVVAGDDQVFRFPVELPGQVAVEAHDAGVLVAELVVRP